MARAGRVVSIKRVKLVVDRFHFRNHIGILSVTLSYGEDFLLADATVDAECQRLHLPYLSLMDQDNQR